MTAVQDRLTTIGLAIQTAQASPAASATYRIGINSGTVVKMDLSEDELPTTWASRLSQGFDRSNVVPGSAFETMALPKFVGLLLRAALPSYTFAAGSPNTHTFKSAANLGGLPYVTVFAQKGTDYYKIQDCAIDELEFAWEGTKALTVKVTIMGCAFTFASSAWPAITDERVTCGVMKGAGGQFQLDGADAIIKSGSVKISNSVEAVNGSNSVTPLDVFPGMQKIETSMVVVPTNMNLWRKVVTGAASGTSIAAVPTYGSAKAQWAVPGAASTDRLTFNGLKMRIAIDFPDTKAEGGPMEFTVVGNVAEPCDGSDPFSFVLENSVASYT